MSRLFYARAGFTPGAVYALAGAVGSRYLRCTRRWQRRYPALRRRQFNQVSERRRRQHKQVKRPALSVIKSSGPHLHPKSSVAYENTRLNYREGTILPVFVCVYLYLPVFACICLHPHLCLLHICRLDAAVGGRSQTRIAGHPGGARRNHQLSLGGQHRYLPTMLT